MDPERWRNLKSLFAAAFDLKDPKERSAFLDRACTGDPELRAELDRLLHEEPETDTAIFAPPQRHALAPGDLIAGRFRIVRFVGQGGMGEVYEAEDHELGGSVALKTLRPDLASDPRFLARFRREVQIARQLTHRNICRIFDFGQDHAGGKNVVFLTMEFLDGETLGRFLQRRGAIPAAEALPLVRQMAAGLGALHESNVVHRDFKPGNVILARSESGPTRAVVTDFGVARAQLTEGEQGTLSQSGDVVGTPDYMAPEQLRGQQATPVSDIYSFGLILYEMLTGRKAFPGGAAMENAVQRLTTEPKPPREHVPGLDPHWEAAILGCLAREPATRIQTAEEVLATIDGSVGSRTATVAAPAPNRRWLLVGMAAAIVLAALLAMWRYPFWKANQAPGTRHVAVLPFKVLGDDPGLQVFADGLMETIASRLSQYESGNTQLTVVPASEIRQQKVVAPTGARRTFAATTAVEGNVQSQDGRVRLILTVIDTGRMVQIDSIVAENNRSRAFDLQDEAVSRLANSLSLRAVESITRETASLRALSPGAYDYYLQAVGYLQRNDKTENIDTAITLLDRALASDPNYAAAWATLGEAYWFKYERTKDPAWITRAVDSCGRAVKANPDLPATHLALGRVRNGTGNYEQARQEYARVLELDPRSSEGLRGLATAYYNLNRFAESEETYRKAIALRPGDWLGYKDLGLYFYRRQELDKSIQQYEEVVRLTPDNALGYVNLGVIHASKGDRGAARKDWERALELDPERLSTLSNLGTLAYQQGDHLRAIGLLQRALKINGRSHFLWHSLAGAYRGVGDAAKASEAERKAVDLAEAELAVNPANGDMAARVAYYRAVAGQTAGIEPLIERALRLAPDKPRALAFVAEAYHYLGKPAKARTIFQTAIAKGLTPDTINQSPVLRELNAAAKGKQQTH